MFRIVVQEVSSIVLFWTQSSLQLVYNCCLSNLSEGPAVPLLLDLSHAVIYLKSCLIITSLSRNNIFTSNTASLSPYKLIQSLGRCTTRHP